MIYLLCFFIGFFAELIDGSLGMAYGVSCTTFLKLSLGLPPMEASSLVHISEIFTSGVSAFSHFKLKNIDKSLFLRLVIPGAVGGMIGALLLSRFGSRLEKPFSVYLMAIGAVLVIKAIRGRPQRERRIGALACPVAAVGGLLDAAGGGGWGPVVTATLLSRGGDAATTIGSVNAAEFFVTLAEVVAFSFALPNLGEHLTSAVLLILGGCAAAPISVLICKRANQRALLLAVGLLVVALNAYKLFF